MPETQLCRFHLGLRKKIFLTLMEVLYGAKKLQETTALIRSFCYLINKSHFLRFFLNNILINYG